MNIVMVVWVTVALVALVVAVVAVAANGAMTDILALGCRGPGRVLQVLRHTM